MSNAIDWFEIFVSDIARATRFYEQMLAVSLRPEELDGKAMAIFPAAKTGVGGALVRDGRRAPGGEGTLIYLNADGQLDACLERALAAGGTVVLPRTDLGGPGFIATIRDSEGNVVGLHSER